MGYILTDYYEIEETTPTNWEETLDRRNDFDSEMQAVLFINSHLKPLAVAKYEKDGTGLYDYTFEVKKKYKIIYD